MELIDAITRWLREPTMVEYLTVMATRQEPIPLDDIWEQISRTISKPVRVFSTHPQRVSSLFLPDSP